MAGLENLLIEYLADPDFHRDRGRYGDCGACRVVHHRAPKADPEKVSAYECGFDAFSDDARGQFDVRFYLVAILFIIFDLEIAFLFPWAISLSEIGVFGFWSMMAFPRHPDNRLYLRMEERRARMGVDAPLWPGWPEQNLTLCLRLPVSLSDKGFVVAQALTN
jgi:NADH:ubiquinone oxidoreductase subunit 3 (subunit A)